MTGQIPLADLTFERAGDVIGCHFEGEEDLALFVPGSGDVLLSSLAQWRSLTRAGGSVAESCVDGVVQVNGLTTESPASELRATLLSLGAVID